MTAEESMILNYLGDIEPSAAKLVLKIRKTIIKYLPKHDESLRWRALAFDKPELKASVKDNVCSIHPKEKKVIVRIPLGSLLEDPQNILEGNQRYKRQLTITKLSEFKNKAVQDIILKSYHYDSNRVLYKELPNTDYKDMASRI